MRLLAAFFVFAALLPAADFRAGAGRVAITPDQPINMIGYANVNRVSEGKSTISGPKPWRSKIPAAGEW